MSQIELQSFHFHHEIIYKEHRENCTTCSSAYSGMGLFVDLIRESEEKSE